MKMKKLCTAVLAAAMVISTGLTAVAADKGSVTFKGEAEKFVSNVSGDEFGGIRPGETRTMTLTLKNDSADSMKFYMSAEILDNIAASGDQTAIYDFQIAKNGAPFFSTVIGDGKNNISAGQQYLTEDNNILLDTLKKGQSDDISLTLALDGNSTNNAYMNKSGVIQLAFSVETPPEVPTVVKKVTNYVNGAVTRVVKTGDAVPIAALAALAVSILVIAAVLIRRLRRNKMEGRS